MKLKVGEIKYSNCTPIYSTLKKQADCSRYEFMPGEPAALNEMLANGEIDVSSSSSIEYARQCGKYLIIPEISISSTGEVGSILLFSKKHLSELAGEKISVSSASATSTVLLKVLLKFHFKIDARLITRPPVLHDMLADASAALLIGDEALREGLRHGDDGRLFIYDLGGIWQDFTGLPFVYALWMVRADKARLYPELAERFRTDLISAKKYAFSNLEAIAQAAPESSWMGHDNLLSYWNAMSYDLTHAHIQGLTRFFELAAQVGEAPGCPALNFL